MSKKKTKAGKRRQGIYPQLDKFTAEQLQAVVDDPASSEWEVAAAKLTIIDREEAEESKAAKSKRQSKAMPPAPAEPIPAKETREQRTARLERTFGKLSPQEQAGFLKAEGVRRDAIAFAGGVLHHSRKRNYHHHTTGGHDIGNASAIVEITDAIARMGCKDLVEEMLVTQMVWAHSRVAYLTSLANNQDGLKQIRTISEALDSAHNVTRRLALALADIRRPAKQFIAAKQFNQAEQQVVQNVAQSNENSRNENRANEKTCLPAPTETLPPFPDRPDFLAGEHREREAVAINAGSGDGGGQGAFESQRLEARPAQRASHTGASGNGRCVEIPEIDAAGAR